MPRDCRKSQSDIGNLRPSMSEPKVFFGREEVSASEKTARVHTVFDSVASRYDVMNDFMSFGTHRVLKRLVVETASLRQGNSVLDAAAGTGDIARLLTRAVGPSGSVTCFDINNSMLREGRDRSIDAGCMDIDFVLADAQQLPFQDAVFDAVTIGFGLRNVADQPRALTEFRRVLRSGGRLVVLDFSKPTNSVLGFAFGTFMRTWPLVGNLVVGTPRPYEYLVESIETHPSQSVLALMLRDNGFNEVRYDNLLGGIAALHWGTAA